MEREKNIGISCDGPFVGDMNQCGLKANDTSPEFFLSKGKCTAVEIWLQNRCS